MTSKGAGAPLTRHVSTVCACRELAPTDCAMRVLRERKTAVNVVNDSQRSKENRQQLVNAVSGPRRALG